MSKAPSPDVVEGNKLIAEFLGKNYSEDKGDGEVGYLFPINGAFNRRLMPAQMQYHLSWDWLLPVVKEIDTKFESCELIGDIFDSFLILEVEWTWKAVVQFIQWFNNQKLKP